MRSLYPPPRHPYYIVAPDYRRTSAGIRVMHQLCHALRQSGEDAWIQTGVTHPTLDTPRLTDEVRAAHRARGLTPIAIYPEVVAANPLDCAVVVRYILNRPGLLGEQPAYGPDDIYYVYEPELLDIVPGATDVLRLPSINTSLFNNRDNPHDAHRSGSCIYFGRYSAGQQEHPDLADTCTVITQDFPATHEELAELLRRSERVYCFENTAISTEARLCGCPVVMLPSPFFSKEKFFGRGQGFDQGVAFTQSPEDLATAARTVGHIATLYESLEAAFWPALDGLITLTQARADAAPKPDPTTRSSRRPTQDDTEYETWRARQTLQEIDAQILAERMMLTWQQRPGIHLLLALHAGEEHLLADTLDSLAAQLYPEWRLTVATALDMPEGVGDISNLQWLALRDAAHIDYVIDEMAAASPGTWLARIEPGLTLEPHALQVIADYINVRPDWRLIYCDEDTLEADGRYTHPLFKPDFNLDLLRAQAYVGSLIVVEKQAFLAAGRFGTLAGAENYDLTLRILDHAGEAAIGHLDQLLAHLPRASVRAMQPEAEKAAVQAHLLRRGLDAEVLDGAGYGTRRVICRWAESPLVSIIIPTRDKVEYLRPFIESLEERTRYRPYELIIVDNDSVDPDTLDYLAALAGRHARVRTRILRQPGEFSWSACANAGAAVAEGDFLLFLDNDLHIVQDDWLDRLVAIAQRPEVGIVAPRLTYPETAKVQQGVWILGMHGTTGNPWDNQLGLTDPGYMGRALCDQNVSAASGSALLVKRAVLTSLNGFDAERFPLLYGALDLCLRATAQGHKIVWTPYAALVHYAGASVVARQRRLEGKLTDLIAAQEANQTLLARWMPRLVSDPAYNRHLSLSFPFKPEHVAPMDWDPHFHDRPRILACPVPGGAGEFRLRAPLRVIGQAGLAQTMICEPPKPFTMRILSPVEVARADPDVLILHQPLEDTQSDALEHYARFLPKVRRILTMDDLVTNLPRKHPLYKSGYKDGRQRLRRVLSFMDRLVVSTQPLADLCADMIDDILVMPNSLEWSLWGDVAPPGRPRTKPRVGWAGAQQHQGDLELIYKVVEALADEVDWIFMGMCPEPIRGFVHEAHGFELDFRAYPRALSRLDLDLAIAPLDVHPFNEAKSNLRLLEYGAMGWPVICTDIYPYQNAPVTRLPNDPDLWIRTIREQIAEPAALKAAGLALQRWVREGYVLENHTARWFAAYGP
ncbi:MAG TPA: glycosyltransferase [Zoogloea sp.]|uniref:glycosyltransferase n=1 Tax=Zoogloea sp. TaxID=49181 RepID=UPI002BBB6E68|nr:glycosyltransferase [Zoogloea sp.]HMV17513.1 glycosyltransferase [Rhodocyclaceae bacterium]HMW50785.1 glycosyltransferase [Rhodocyclaceae bacterium]HNA66478.1 glycosyltransferase [Rhodocyclaceae bacterium]HNB63878.1 glycosyltransferase [Rhodocyclaceae bacterium]HNC79715.1 glycosyltransferase [Rhodocyclaceae bacterium]